MYMSNYMEALEEANNKVREYLLRELTKRYANL